MDRGTFLKILGATGSGFLCSGEISAKSDIFLDRKNIKVYDNYVQVLRYYDWKNLRHQISQGDQVSLKRDTQNEYDSFAVAVIYQEHQLGYLPAYENIVIANLLDHGVAVTSQVSQLKLDEDDEDGYYSEELAVEVFLDVLTPRYHIKTNELTNQRASDSDDLYRQRYSFK